MTVSNILMGVNEYILLDECNKDAKALEDETLIVGKIHEQSLDYFKNKGTLDKIVDQLDRKELASNKQYQKAIKIIFNGKKIFNEVEQVQPSKDEGYEKVKNCLAHVDQALRTSSPVAAIRPFLADAQQQFLENKCDGSCLHYNTFHEMALKRFFNDLDPDQTGEIVYNLAYQSSKKILPDADEQLRIFASYPYTALITDKYLSAVANKQKASIYTVDLRGCEYVSAKGIKKFVKSCPKLISLTITADQISQDPRLVNDFINSLELQYPKLHIKV